MARHRHRLRSLEILEDRTAPAIYGQPWATPTHLTVSFAPDGTPIGGQVSDLFKTLNVSQPTVSWQQTILEAVQAWASQANLNVGLVSDGGQPFGTPALNLGDTRFGDIRIGAATMGQDSAAVSFPPDAYFAGFWSGDIVLNDSVKANASPSDLYAIMLHELGHSFALPDSTDPTSVMYEQPALPASQLSPSDVSAIQALYGPPDSSLSSHNSLATPLPIPTPQPFNGSTPIVAYGDINSAQTLVVYSFTPPSNVHGGVTVRLVTAGLSLLDPLVSVVDGSGKLLGRASSTDLGGGAVTIQLPALSPGSAYYAEVQAATPGPFDSGRFGLAVSFHHDDEISASQVDSVLRGPNESLTADQIAQLFGESKGVSAGSPAPGNSLATAVALTTTPGFAPHTRFEAIANMRQLPTQGYYRFQAPAATGIEPLVVTAGLDMSSSEGNRGQIDLLDATGNVVPSVVLMQASGVETIQATGLTPGAIYFLRISTSNGDDSTSSGDKSEGGGQAVLVADFLEGNSIDRTLETNTLTAASPQASSMLFVARSGFFQTELTASTTTSAEGGAVRMTILDENGNVVLDITARAGGAAVVGGVMLTPGPYTIKFSAILGEDDSSPALTYSVQVRPLSDPIGVVVHNPTYKPIYVSPTKSTVPYWYPDGSQSTISYLWRAGVVLFPDGTSASVPQDFQAIGSSLSWSTPAHLLLNDAIVSYDLTITASNGQTDPFIVKSPSTSLDLSGLLAPGAYTATVYAVDSQGFAGAISVPVSLMIAPAGGAAGGVNGGVSNPGAPPAPAAVPPVASPPDSNQPTAPLSSLSSASTTTKAESTTSTNAATARAKHAGHRHAGPSRFASRPRHRSAGRVAHRQIA
jgi:hypothetical protein